MEENKTVNEKETLLKIEYKAIVKMLNKQKRIGLLNKSECDYLKAYHLLNLSNKQN